jgi:hypothetical protein
VQGGSHAELASNPIPVTSKLEHNSVEIDVRAWGAGDGERGGAEGFGRSGPGGRRAAR